MSLVLRLFADVYLSRVSAWLAPTLLRQQASCPSSQFQKGSTPGNGSSTFIFLLMLRLNDYNDIGIAGFFNTVIIVRALAGAAWQ